VKVKRLTEKTENLLKNGSLRLKGNRPAAWHVEAVNCRAEVFRSDSERCTLVGPTGKGRVNISQTIRCWSGKHYRLDIWAEPAGRGRSSRRPVGEIKATFASERAGKTLETHSPPAMRVSGDCRIWRAYYQPAQGAGKLRISLQIRTSGSVRLRMVRLVDCGESVLSGHPLALPPEPWQVRHPAPAKKVLLCDGRKDRRGLLQWLQHTLGRSAVRRISPARLKNLALQSRNSRDSKGQVAIVIDSPDVNPLGLDDLLRLADSRLVIVSLRTFAESAARAGIRGLSVVERITGDDMPAGKVVLAGFLIRGLALADVVPCGWSDGGIDFAHRYLKLTRSAKAALAKLGIEPVIVTETGYADSSGHPTVMLKQTANAALVVIDPDGLESPPAGENERNIHELLWRNALGSETVTLGQFVVADLDYKKIKLDLDELSRRFDAIGNGLHVSDGVAASALPPMWLVPKPTTLLTPDSPTVLIRTGFGPADWPCIYGLIFWLKRLASRLSRGDEPARLLLSNLKILALPIAEPGRWPGCPREVAKPEPQFEPNALAGLIEITVHHERSEVLVRVPDSLSARLAREALADPAIALPAATNHAAKKAGKRQSIEVVIDARQFRGGIERQAARLRVPSIRLLLPSTLEATPADSPAMTDLAACVLEKLVYAFVGRFTVNRAWKPMPVTLTGVDGCKSVTLFAPDGHIRQIAPAGRNRMTLKPGWAMLMETVKQPIAGKTSRGRR